MRMQLDCCCGARLIARAPRRFAGTLDGHIERWRAMHATCPAMQSVREYEAALAESEGLAIGSQAPEPLPEVSFGDGYARVGANTGGNTGSPATMPVATRFHDAVALGWVEPHWPEPVRKAALAALRFRMKSESGTFYELLRMACERLSNPNATDDVDQSFPAAAAPPQPDLGKLRPVDLDVDPG